MLHRRPPGRRGKARVKAGLATTRLANEGLASGSQR